MVVSKIRIRGTEPFIRRVARSQILGFFFVKTVFAALLGKALLGSNLGGAIGAGIAWVGIGYFLHESESRLPISDPQADSVWSGVRRVFRQCVDQCAPNEALRLQDTGASLSYPVILKCLSDQFRGVDFGVWRGLWSRKTVISVPYSAANTLTEQELTELFKIALSESQKPDLAWECLYLRAVSWVGWVSGSSQAELLIRSSGPVPVTQAGLAPLSALRLAYGLFLLEGLERLWFRSDNETLPLARRILVKSPLSGFLKTG